MANKSKKPLQVRPTPKAAGGKAFGDVILPPSIVPENGGKSNEN